MTDDLVHLHPAYRPYAALSPDERIQWTRHDRWISYERAEQILLRLADLLTYPPRDRMPALLIFGATDPATYCYTSLLPENIEGC
jgi:hypothetical protein